MLHFIHTYTEKSFPGLVKNGLWRVGDGLKLMHKPGFSPPHDFNSAAAVGSPLERLLRELNCPFYVDRLQGGIGFTKIYPYDPALLAHYREMLGERFLGFQMHEWASNLRSDEGRIRELCRREGVDETDPAALSGLWRRVKDGSLPLFLEARSAEEWENTPLSTDLTSFWRSAEALYARRARETDGLLFPADSYFMAPRAEIENGAKLLLPEAGWQIPNLRIQLALTRGMASAAGVPWGIYYECWQNTADAGLTIPFSLREGQDEWQEDMLHTANGSALPFVRREHGGSSLSLMARAWRLAYFSGASYMAEEYGVCNTFRELREYTLSPYGETKREFLRFTEAFPDVGAPYVPLAAVLPKELRMLDITLGDRYLEYPLTDPACPLPPERMNAFRAAMEAIFGTQGRHGNSGHVLKNGGLPAVCDLVYEDMPEALKRYDYLIDLTGDPLALSRKGTVVSVEEADRLLDALLPCRVGGGLFTAYNRRENGWYVLVMNHDGVRHDGFLPDELLPEATVRAPVTPRKPETRLAKAAGDGLLEQTEGGCTVTLRAGGWLLLTAE